MKKALLFFTAIAIASCGGSATDCQYNTVVTTTYNMNAEAASLVVGKDTLKGCFMTTKTDGQAQIKEAEDKMSIIIKDNPNSFLVTKDGKQREWTQEHGYKLSNEMSGDTLILRHMPTALTPANVLKFGTEYKFYK